MAKRSDLAKRMQDVIAQANAQGWKAKLRRAGHWKLTAPGGGVVFVAATPSDHRAVKNNISIMRRYGFVPEGKMAQSNPQKQTHRKRAVEHLATARRSLNWGRFHLEAKEGDQRDNFRKGLEGILDAIKYAGAAKTEAADAKDIGLMDRADALGDEAVAAAGEVVLRIKKNPADIPGGSMSACIDIMGARPDVESPGALCNWLAQRAGESLGGRFVVRMPKKMTKHQKEQRKTLRKLMRL